MTLRMAVVSAIVGAVLAVVSVPVGKIISDRVLRTPNAQAFQGRFWLDKGDHQIYIYHRRDPFRAHWESSIVPTGMYDAPGPEFERPASDPRPLQSRRAFTGLCNRSCRRRRAGLGRPARGGPSWTARPRGSGARGYRR